MSSRAAAFRFPTGSLGTRKDSVASV